jgi:hypothetical protein
MTLRHGTERDLQASIVEIARAYGWRHWHDNDSRRNQSGWPDLALWHPERAKRNVWPALCLWELKGHGGRIRPEQRATVDALEEIAGVSGGLIDARIVWPSDYELCIELLQWSGYVR